MKKQLLLLSILLPSFTFAQALSNDSSSIIGIIFGLAIFVGLFFLFRGILLWYWKVDIIVKNQEETNSYLKSIDTDSANFWATQYKFAKMKGDSNEMLHALQKYIFKRVRQETGDDKKRVFEQLKESHGAIMEGLGGKFPEWDKSIF